MKASDRVKVSRKDLRRDTFRSGGPGGQHQNKTESGVRWTHLPTGISAESRSDRSQSINDEMAYEAMCQKLVDLVMLRRHGNARQAWKDKPRAAMGGTQLRSYVLAGNAQRVVDHETGWEGNPRSVLNGELDDLLRVRLAEGSRSEWVQDVTTEAR